MKGYPRLDYPETDPPLIEAYRVYLRGVEGLVWLPGAVHGRTKADALAMAVERHGGDAKDYLLTTTEGPILPRSTLWKPREGP